MSERTFRAYDLSDMKRISADEKEALKAAVTPYSDRDWDIRMNSYICRYI